MSPTYSDLEEAPPTFMHYEVAFAALGGLLDLGSPKGLKGYSVQSNRPVSTALIDPS